MPPHPGASYLATLLFIKHFHKRADSIKKKGNLVFLYLLRKGNGWSYFNIYLPPSISVKLL